MREFKFPKWELSMSILWTILIGFIAGVIAKLSISLVGGIGGSWPRTSPSSPLAKGQIDFCDHVDASSGSSAPA
jgi:hypothetical protein